MHRLAHVSIASGRSGFMNGWTIFHIFPLRMLCEWCVSYVCQIIPASCRNRVNKHWKKVKKKVQSILFTSFYCWRCTKVLLHPPFKAKLFDQRQPAQYATHLPERKTPSGHWDWHRELIGSLVEPSREMWKRKSLNRIKLRPLLRNPKASPGCTRVPGTRD